MKKILLRADGNNQIGFGHIFRLIALYEMLSEHYECTFLCLESGYTHAIKERNIPFFLIPSEADEINYIAKQFDANQHLIIVDGYQFDKKYFSSLREVGYASIYIDDMYQEEYPVDIIINHSPNSSALRYANSKATIALGTDYALIRKAFFAPVNAKSSDQVENVFVCFGGADPEKIGYRIQKILSEIPSLKNIHVLGKKNDQIDHRENINPKFEYHSNLDEFQMSALMDQCQLAIAPSSTICFELCSRNVATIAGHFIDNQRDIYEGFKNLECIIPVGDYTKLKDFELKWIIENCIEGNQLSRIEQNQNLLFDGLVQKRILKLLEPYA